MGRVDGQIGERHGIGASVVHRGAVVDRDHEGNVVVVLAVPFHPDTQPGRECRGQRVGVAAQGIAFRIPLLDIDVGAGERHQYMLVGVGPGRGRSGVPGLGELVTPAVEHLRGGHHGPPDLGPVAPGLAQIGAEALPPSPGPRLGVTQIPALAQDRFHDRGHRSGAVDQAVRQRQRHSRRTVAERLDAQVPAGTVLGIDRDLRPLLQPVRQFRTRAGGFGDVERPLDGRRGDPPGATERQRRTLDTPGRQAPAEVRVEAAQAVEIDGPFVEPHRQHDLDPAAGPVRQKGRLVHVVQTVLRTVQLLRQLAEPAAAGPLRPGISGQDRPGPSLFDCRNWDCRGVIRRRQTGRTRPASLPRARAERPWCSRRPAGNRSRPSTPGRSSAWR